MARSNRVRTSTVLQMEAVECGAASLAMILAYYRKFVPLEELRIACGVSRDGSKASNILKAARQYGLIAKGYRKEPASLQSMTMPVIIHWNFNHFVVLEGFAKGKAYLNDPAAGVRVLTLEEFDSGFTGVALAFEPEASFQREKRTPSLRSSLQSRLRPVRWTLLYVTLISFLLTVPGFVIPVLSQSFVDDVLLGGRTDWLLPLLLGLAASALLRGLFTWLQQYYLLRMESKLAIGMASRFIWHMLRAPIEFFAQRQSGDLSSRMASNDRVARLLSGELAASFLNAFMVAFFTFMMVQYSLVLTGIGMAAVLLNIALLRWLSRFRTVHSMKLMQEHGKLYGTLTNGLQLIETIKASGAESDLFAKLAGHQAKAAQAEQQLGGSSHLLSAVPSFLTAASSAAILCAGGYEVLNGRMTVGMLVAFQSLLQSFITPVNELVSMTARLQEVKADLSRLDDVLRYPLDEEARTPGTVDGTSAHAGAAKLAGSIELRDVTFGYSRLAPPLIEGLNLKVEPGARIAIVGGSGSGKSTVAKLISGLYRPWSGEIRLDGKLRSEWPDKVLQLSVGIVDQDIRMFEGTIRDNITLWDSAISETDVIRAAKDSCIHDDIVTRPDGYAHRIEEGARNFSGGQKQRLEIARALVNNPSVLVLDEATSALDPRTELLIDRALRRRGCTCIIVAHRLSTIRDCDEIIVLDGGKVVQRGTHEEMKNADGLYAELIRQA